MKKMRYTEENNNIIHEIGHLIMYTLWMSRKKEFGRSYFTNRIYEISIIEKNDSFGRVTINKEALVDRYCAKLIHLSGVLFSLEYVEHPDMLWWFENRKQVRKNFVEVYFKLGGSSDLLWVLRNSTNSTAIYIHEIKKMIQTIRKDKAIKKIVHKLYKELQKNRYLSGDKCYSIIKPYIPELRILGQQIYNPFTRFKINAKAILFQ